MNKQEILVYLKGIKFEKQLEKLYKLKDKKIVFYGAGEFFEVIKNNYDLSGFNVIGLCDKRFYLEQEGQEFLGYKIIPYEKLKCYDMDVVLISTLKYLPIWDDLDKAFKGRKVKILPLAEKTFLSVLKEIFG